MVLTKKPASASQRARWLERPISEGIPKDIISDELKDQAEDAVKSYIIASHKDIAHT